MNDVQEQPPIMPLHGPHGWVQHEEYGRKVFSGESGARWFFDGEMRARIVKKDPTAFFRRGRTIMTANPAGLLRATVACMQEDAAERVLLIAGEAPASAGGKARVSTLRASTSEST